MTIEDLRQQARAIWGDKPMTLEHITVTIGVVFGDICRQTRAKIETGQVDEQELQKELGNLITSCIRWCEDLGFDPHDCINRSLEAQKAYQPRWSRENEASRE